MTTLVAPVVGPIPGGWLVDDYTWNWMFLINAPIAIGFGLGAWKMLKRYQDASARNPFDKVGLLLLLVWVVALQLALDEGKNLDWFASSEIVALSIIAVVGFAAFLIWELHEKHPAVDLRVFRHRGFRGPPPARRGGPCAVAAGLRCASRKSHEKRTAQWITDIF